MEIIHQKGYAIEKDVDIVVNSANGQLILGSSGAGKIRERSQELSSDELVELEELMEKIPKRIKKMYEHGRKVHGWDYKYATISCVKLLIENGEVNVGEAILDKGWSKSDKRPVIHAVTMTYDPETHERIKGTKLSVQTAIEAALRVAVSEDAKSIALPIPVSRPEYGIGAEESLDAVMSALEIVEETDMKIIICHDNKYTENLLEK